MRWEEFIAICASKFYSLGRLRIVQVDLQPAQTVPEREVGKSTKIVLSLPSF